MNRSVYTVYQVNRYIKSILEEDVLLSGIFVEGEISNFKLHSSGHMYFSLKDENGALACVMFRAQGQKLSFMPENGMKIVVLGRVSLYEKTGQYQLYVQDMEPLGKGGLFMGFEQVKAKLRAEGLFDDIHKQPIPELPATVAVITSPTGAAVRDIIHVAQRRNKTVELVIIPVLVQGENAAQQIAEAVRDVNNWGKADLIIVARGGGSAEDLWPFNDENLARAVFASGIPVISAVGHETDYTIIDFVADVRAATPSAAAEIGVPELDAITGALAFLNARLERAVFTRLDSHRQKLDALTKKTSAEGFLTGIYNRQIHLEQLMRRMSREMRHRLELGRSRLAKAAEAAHGRSPMAALGRGYALVYGEGGGVKTSVSEISAGENLILHMQDGEVSVRAEERR